MSVCSQAHPARLRTGGDGSPRAANRDFRSVQPREAARRMPACDRGIRERGCRVGVGAVHSRTLVSVHRVAFAMPAARHHPDARVTASEKSPRSVPKTHDASDVASAIVCDQGAEPLQRAGEKTATTIEHLPTKEVINSVNHGNKKGAFCSDFLFQDKPSDGLEPSTPPCHRGLERDARVSVGHQRHANPANRRDQPRRSDRAWSRVPALVFPPCSLEWCEP